MLNGLNCECMYICLNCTYERAYMYVRRVSRVTAGVSVTPQMEAPEVRRSLRGTSGRQQRHSVRVQRTTSSLQLALCCSSAHII